MYYKLTITETARNSLKDEPKIFNVEQFSYKTLDEVKQALIERYGKIPKRTISNTIFRNLPEKQSYPVGYLYSFWTRDWSHSDTKKYFQTDWIEVREVLETPVLVN